MPFKIEKKIVTTVGEVSVSDLDPETLVITYASQDDNTTITLNHAAAKYVSDEILSLIVPAPKPEKKTQKGREWTPEQREAARVRSKQVWKDRQPVQPATISMPPRKLTATASEAIDLAMRKSGRSDIEVAMRQSPQGTSIYYSIQTTGALMDGYRQGWLIVRASDHPQLIDIETTQKPHFNLEHASTEGNMAQVDTIARAIKSIRQHFPKDK